MIVYYFGPSESQGEPDSPLHTPQAEWPVVFSVSFIFFIFLLVSEPDLTEKVELLGGSGFTRKTGEP